MSTRPKPASTARKTRARVEKARAAVDGASGVALRLAIARDGVGLELAGAAWLACLRVTELRTTFRGVRFPVDVSGGVARFRHRRGDLQRLEIELGARTLERWAAPRLSGIVGARAPEVWVAVGPALATLCVSAEPDPEDERPLLAPAIAFDVHALAEGDRLVLVVANARGANLSAPATAIAIACVGALLGRRAERAGAAFELAGVATAITRALLPDAGARAPSAVDVPVSVLAAQSDTWILQVARGALPAAPSENAVRARAIAAEVREGDDWLVQGDVERARVAFFAALERAPRHDEIVRRIVEIDARTPGREEAALATFAESASGRETTRAGTIRGELLAATGDITAAIASLEHVATAEPAPALSSRAYERAASLAQDPEDASLWLDHALARAPRAIGARWSRVVTRVSLGRTEDALADVGHLEALARGVHAKHAVWMRAGHAWQAAGLRTRAGAIFERALRYVPDDPLALAGLGEALVAEGSSARGVSILGHALALARQRNEPTGSILIPLARAFAERLDDLPDAIAHVATVPNDATEAPIARGLEARWRARLGDHVGASLAFARVREIGASLAASVLQAPWDPRSASDEKGRAVVAFLLEGADFERTQRDDALAARRHLAVALRLRPHDDDVRQAHRAAYPPAGPHRTDPIARPLAPAIRDIDVDVDEREPAAALAPASATEGRAPGGGWPGIADADTLAPSDEDIARAARADELTRRVQADPTDDDAADELAALLEALGRGHELLALLSARLEDSPPDRRGALVPRVRAALSRLAVAAEAAGHRDEASLYRSVLDALH